MPLAPGVRFGPYEVVAALGSGGMGEVYRARDGRLGRDVALKVLPLEVSGDAVRRARFEEEARAASALSHPNIVVVYDVGESQGTHYVAMELVEGRTLRELLETGALGTRRLLDLGVQLAEGLARAHAAGIVHRDLKPENVMVASDGLLKILDFGLAKLAAGRSGEASTRTQLTAPGVVLGTVGYMSPEQAAGRDVDSRSDQFSLGAILYEMAGGRPAFRRDTPVETLTAILREEPAPLGQVSPETPPPLRWVVERCLAKDADDRYVSTRDLARELRTLRDRLSEASWPGAPSPRAATPLRRWRALAGVAAAAAVGLAGGLWLARGPVEPGPAWRQITFQRGRVNAARFGADGHSIVYSGAWEGEELHLYLRPPEARDALALPLPPADLAAVSRSGELTLLRGCERGSPGVCPGTLSLTPISAGSTRELAAAVTAADWAPDGTLLVVRAVGESLSLEWPPGQRHHATARGLRCARFSPRGDAVAVIEHPVRYSGAGSVLLFEGSGPRVLAADWDVVDGLAWAPKGDEVWFSGSRAGEARALYAVDRQGRLRPVARVPGSLRLHDISPTGQVLLARETVLYETRGQAPGQTGERSLGWLDGSMAADLSADGRTLLFAEASQALGREPAICLRGTDGAAVVRLVNGEPLALSPDKRSVLARLPGSAGLAVVPAGPGQATTLPTPGGVEVGRARWLQDGRVLYLGQDGSRRVRLYVQARDGTPARAVAELSPRELSSPVVASPDGRTVVVGGPPTLVSADGEVRPVGGALPADDVLALGTDGRTLYVRQRRQLPSQISTIDLAKGERRAWRDLAPPDGAGVRRVERVLMTPDGSGYVYSYARMLADLYLADGLR